MMIAPLLLVVAIPSDATIVYTGFPVLKATTSVQTPTHSVEMRVVGDRLVGHSITGVRNPSGEPLRVSVSLPTVTQGKIGEPSPTITLGATWRGVAIRLAPSTAASSTDTTGRVNADAMYAAAFTLPPRSTGALRVDFSAPLGVVGRDRKQRLVAYRLPADARVGQLNMAIRYSEPDVFRLPEVSPQPGWQVGARGAFLRVPNYESKTASDVTATFYPGGFGD